jgi:recombination protein RecA
MSKEKEAQLKKLRKDMGECVIKASDILAEKNELKTLSCSPALDHSLNGGIQEGSWSIITGAPKTGKTSTVLQICANAQKDGRKVIYFDGEGRIKKYNLLGIDGLDLESMEMVRAPEGKILSAEEALTILETLIQHPDNKGAVVVVDSISSLIPQRDIETMVDGERRPGLPKILSDFMRRMGQVIPRTKTMVFMIRHLITNTSGYGKKFVADGGVKIQYQADTLVQVRMSEDWVVDGQKIGQKITWDVQTSSLGASGTQAVSYFRYNKGIDKIQEIIELAESFDVVDKAGAWYSLPFMERHDPEYTDKKYKFQGVANLYKFLDENESVMQKLEEEMKVFLE